MNEDINRKKALFKKLSDELSRRTRTEDLPKEKLQQLLKLKDDTAKAIGREMREFQASPQVIKNVTDKINSKEVIGVVPEVTEKINTNLLHKKIPKATEKILDSKMTVKSGEEFAENIAKKLARNKALKKAAGNAIGKFAKTGLKSLPLIGGAIAALSSGDASAAVPILSEAESLGPKEGSPSSVIEDMSASPEERLKALKLLKQQTEK